MRLAPVHVPRPLDPFIGRRVEIEELRHILARTRLVTLSGPGGCGKTRLALELATEIGPRYASGVAFVELASVHDPTAVRESITASLDLLQEGSEWTPEPAGDARVLLVVDNVEHVLDPVSTLIQELLASRPYLSVLATGRELLDVAGEVSWRVPPLRLPPAAVPGVATGVAEMASCDSVQLFCARVAEQQPDFRLTADNAAPVAAICRRLDGIPLALELAAARVRSLGLTSVLERLDDSFQLLVSGSRSAAPRHRTLQATFDWSHSLLNERERRLLRRLSVFVGSCDLAAIEAVCSGPDLPPAEVAHVLHGLVDKSLVVAGGQPDGGMRYGLIEIIRQYARQCLSREEPAERGPLQERHAHHYAGLVMRLDAGSRNRSASVVESTRRLGVEYDNVRLALDWSAGEAPAQQAAIALRLIDFWHLRGSVLEARRFLTSAVRADVTVDVRAKLYRALAGFSLETGDLEAAATQIEEAFRLLDQVTDAAIAGAILLQRGAIRAEREDLEGAEHDFRQTLRLLDGLPPSYERAAALNNLAVVRLMAGHPADALRLVQESVETSGRLAVPLSSSTFSQVLDTYGQVLLALDRVDEARDRFLAGLELAAESGSDSDALALLHGLATVSARTGDAAGCLELLAAASACATRRGRTLTSTVAAGYQETVREARGRLGSQLADAAWASGLTMDVAAALERARGGRGRPPAGLLTRRKAEIVRLVALGLANREIGRRLSISERTVEAHLEQVRNQLGFRNRVQIAAWAATGLADDGS